MKDRKKPDKFVLPHRMPSDDRAFAFSSRVFPKAAQIKAPYKLWHYQKSTQVVNLLLALTLLPDRRSSWYPAFFCCLTGGRFLGAVTEDTLNALMENALVFLRYMLLVYYFFASSNRTIIFLATTSIETLCSLAVRNIISMCSWSITFLPQEHMALTLICFVMIFMEVNKRIFYLRPGLFGLSSQPETVAKIPSFVVKRRIIPL